MTLLEIGLTLSLAFGPGDAGMTFEMTPRVHLGAPSAITLPWRPSSPRCGIAFPYVAVTSYTRWCTVENDTVGHENGHLDQYDALGPAVALVYGLSGGSAIEDYIGPEGSTWFPEKKDLGRCPLLRVTSDGDTTFAPCYNPWSLLGL